MSPDFTIDARQFQKLAKALPGKMERKVYRGAVSRTATIVLKSAREFAIGSIKKAVTKRAENKAREGYFGSKIGVKSGVFRSERTARRRGVGAIYQPDEVIRFYRFLELGTKYHKAKPFLRRALASEKGRVKPKMENELFKGLAKLK
jgi:HK97 gp10 family phage protein